MELLDALQPYSALLATYAAPPTNYIGAAVFLAYILLALYATISIVVSLYGQYREIYHSTAPAQAKRGKDAGSTANLHSLQDARAARKRHVKIYAFLASVSFAALAYHMLGFLVAHYLAWSGRLEIGKLDAGRLGQWMLESGLFRDFADELVASAQGAMWTQLAVLGTWGWNVYMARTARLHALPASTMRTFILLSQILPISFTASLFLIQCHLSSPDMHPPPLPPPPPTSSPPKTKPIATLHLPNILLNASLLALPSLRTHPIFTSLVLFTRLILLLPHSGLLKLRTKDVDKCLIASAGFIVAGRWQGVKAGMKLGSEVRALGGSGGYAVRAMGWDAVLGVVAWGCLEWGGGV